MKHPPQRRATTWTRKSERPAEGIGEQAPPLRRAEAPPAIGADRTGLDITGHSAREPCRTDEALTSPIFGWREKSESHRTGPRVMRKTGRFRPCSALERGATRESKTPWRATSDGRNSHVEARFGSGPRG